ncbi:dTMP kinase [Pollutimonas thiosulfatoxidans]|uniref:Thymidylate kinase n=1 Tax=Pollutimonas thiosulfatoxidans TaxID=2028345 RepID=A0A410GAV0_9BURK|nr:dTMP kinase [Pollutimonas thiosulfatoxidans]MBF6615918.1 dTMP kinase [Candidimonas sp.]QAA93420.1 dTMP kinase [Pollutimonas thiosulfatoxidans]
MDVQRGCFITLEGLDGAGKSTHIEWLVDQLGQRGLSVIATREPGGTALGEALRELLLHRPMHLKSETLLMFAARCEHVETVIKPALAAGKWVVCDRFTDATYAYQGGGRQLGATAVAALEHWVHADLQPDRSWLFDVPLEVARERLARTRDLDRFEQEGAAFFERTRQAYHDRVAQHPERILIVDSTLPIARIREGLCEDIDALLRRHRDGPAAVAAS